MHFAAGVLLVLGTWLVALACVILCGTAAALVSKSTPVRARDLARASWWGLAILGICAYALNFYWPLRSWQVICGLLLATAALAIVGGLRMRRLGLNLRVSGKALSHGPGLLLLAASTAAVLVWAVAAMGAVTHYDAGLYQVAATWYAADFPAIPGISNLYGPLGYASVEPLYGAILGNAGLGADSYRAVNGFFLLLFILEVLARLAERPKRPGTSLGVVALFAVGVPMLWMSDFWVTSPTPDLPVLVLSLTALLYWTDQVTGSRTVGQTLGTTITLSALLVAMRPTTLPLAIALIAGGWGLAVRRKGHFSLAPGVLSMVIGGTMIILVLLRDRILSGWLFYPLSVAPLDVAWRAPDPVGLREATLGFARNPGDYSSAISGWGWVQPWLARWNQQWDPWWILAFVLLGLGLLVMAHRRGVVLLPRTLAVILTPFLLAMVVWILFSPPAFRFGWGPLFGIGVGLAGWGIWRLGLERSAVVAVSAGLVAVALAAAVTRVHWVAQPVPLPTAEVTTIRLSSGLEISSPTTGDQCWAVYPLCTPTVRPSLTPLGRTFSDGLVP